MSRLRNLRNLGVVLLATMMMSAVVTPVAVAGEEELDAEASVGAVLLANPTLQRAPGPTPTIDLTGGGLSATVVLGTEAIIDLDIPDVGGSEIFDRENRELRKSPAPRDVAQPREVELVRHDSRGNQASRSGERLVVEDDESGVTTVVEGAVDGLRMFEVIGTENSVHKFSYGISIDGRQAQFFVQDDISILVGWGNKNEFTAVGHIDAPWAFDTDGQPVDASYKVTENGRTLQLTVDRNTEAAYPITADPSFRTWAGVVDCSWTNCTFYLERVKTYWIRNTFATHGFAVASAIVAARLCM